MSTDANTNEDGKELGIVFESWLDRVKFALRQEESHEQFRIAAHGLRWLDLMLRKNNDYGGAVWSAPVLRPNLSPNDAILVRMSDKIQRLQSLFTKQQPVKAIREETIECEVDESIEDTISDLGAYCLLYLANPNK